MAQITKGAQVAIEAVCNHPDPENPLEDFLAATMFVAGNQEDPIGYVTDEELAEIVVHANEDGPHGVAQALST
ncbi:hypothetical protein [Halosimplex pelagicum]|uniref:Uncharacterized protein n=1 Tax=Halosimplex pelagicum TaxID=869886 RepID=A0A7D5PE73_9EURY|nr:hypothetical protein [Halosimplex pelagicum]QLH84822.1 hypothetical protein HZS54_25750 [Halosimplex pelagicum]